MSTSIPLVLNFGLKAPLPLDSRIIVNQTGDLNNFQSYEIYSGMQVYSADTKKIYYLKDTNTWAEVGLDLPTTILYTTGNQTISGTKTFLENVVINNLTVTGFESIVNTNNINIGSNYLLLNVTGGAGIIHGPASDGGIFFVTGDNQTGINDTGAILGFDAPSNKWVFGYASRNDDIQFLNEIASVSLVQQLSGSSVLLNQTGDFYPKSNPSGFITGVNLSNYYTKDNPSGFITGVDLSNYITKTNGQFTNRPFVNGTGVLLSGEAANLPNTIVYTTGDQTVSGIKTFSSAPVCNAGIDLANQTMIKAVPNIISIGAAPTLTDLMHNGRVIYMTNSSLATITIPSGLSPGFNCTIIQGGAGSVAIGAGTNVILNGYLSSKTLAGQYAAASILSISLNNYIIYGNTV